MAQTRYQIPANTTIRVAKKGNIEYVLTPPGTTGYTPPTSPASDSCWTETHEVAYELILDDGSQIQDAGNPHKVFHKYVGGRPNDR